MRPIKFRAWDTLYNEMIYDVQFRRGDRTFDQFLDSRYALMQFTGLFDKNGLTDIYEGDIIDENSNIRGNIYETVDKRTTDLVITGMGTEAWRSTEQAAMDRGCKYAK